MKRLRADLHIHTVLSACAGLSMSPRRVVDEARRAGLALIAVADHNAAANGPYVREIARGEPRVLLGMELQSQEEVEILALFEDADSCLTLEAEVYRDLPDVNCDPELFGDQVVVDEQDNIVRRVEKLLLSPVPWPLARLVKRVEDLHGWTLPAHVDRVPGGLLAVLGLLPEGTWPEAAELSPWVRQAEAVSRWPELAKLPLLRSSDAHFPHEIGRSWSELTVAEPSLAELRAAAEGRGGRRLRAGPHCKEGR